MYVKEPPLSQSILVKFKSNSRKKAKTRLFIRKIPNEVGTTLELLIKTFDKIGCPKSFVKLLG